VLLILFFVDWYLVDLMHAVLIVLRLSMLTGSFAVVVETTPPGELRLVFHWLRIPHRYAFSLSIAFQSIDLLSEEWQLIQEAQQARGAWQPVQRTQMAGAARQVRQMVALTVPAVVLTTRRAWNLTEAAYARGFDAPGRRPYTTLQIRRADWLVSC
jgi:energy-coupling factor transporter transmembrane protein EcfT